MTGCEPPEDDVDPHVFRVGDEVRIVAIPDWLVHDLPVEEQTTIRSVVGRQMRICKVDAHGYLWFEFSATTGLGQCAGSSFCLQVQDVVKFTQ